MKIFFLLLATCVATGSAWAQVQDPKVASRLSSIKDPDLRKGTPFQNQTFIKPSSSFGQPSSLGSKTFLGSKEASTQAFALTKSFLGIKNPWIGKDVFATGNAPLWTKSIVETANAKVLVRKAEVVPARDANKTAKLGDQAVPTKNFVPVPSSQGGVTDMVTKIKANMTIDEIRELLNKPR